ncbi:hypothetical protein niasHT_019871 [Heterodera trifolii]|uniref:HAT C-terminal dimerisation domain-containing protein n=1 Tax=Heterodera trifolii TaxID=157864 RepID=A0ABD2L5D7_9BILA
MALLSPRFDVLVDKHFNGTEKKIWRTVEIHKDFGAKPKLCVVIGDDSSYRDSTIEYAFPDRPLPNKVRFEDLRITYIDHTVISFLRANQKVFDKPTDLCLRIFEVMPIVWNVFVREIWPIFAANIHRLTFVCGADLANLRHHISPTILTDLKRLISIDSGDLFPAVIGDDVPNATAGQALSKWLHTPTRDGQSKQLCCKDYNSLRNIGWVNDFKEEFLRATTTTCASYAIRFVLRVATPIVPFEVVNELTKEKLTLETENDGHYNANWLLKRCPIIEETGTVQQQNKDEENLAHLCNVRFWLYCVSCIGTIHKSSAKTVQYPFPDRPLPNKIRFENLRIAYIDHSVITFLRANQQIFDNVLCQTFAIFTYPNADHLYSLLRFTSPKVLSDLNIHSIDSGRLFPNAIDSGAELFDEIGGDFDGPNAYSVGQILSKWLVTRERVRAGPVYGQLGEKTKDESQKKLSTFFPCSSSTLTVMDKKVVNFLVSTNSSFKVVDHPTFQSLIAPQQIKKEAHYRAEVLPEVYKQVKNKVRDELKECESISFTTDAWSGPTNNFLCLTAHGITPNWTMKNHVLAVTEFQGTHSGKEIAKLLSKIIADWEICPTKIHCFLRDSAANMKSAFSQTDVDDNGFTIQILAYENVSCGAHLLNLVVQKSIRSERVADLLKQCRKVVAHFKHSNKALGMLKDIQIFLDLPDHSLLQEVSVRWNSALGMISRLFEQREALYQYAFENRNFEMTLTNEEWGLIEEMISLLQPIEEASKMLVKSPLSAQIPIALTLHGKLYTAKLINKDIDVVRCSLVNELEKYFFALREKRVHCLSTFLDLRFKDKFLLEGRNIFLAKISSWLKEELGDFVLPLINENDEIALAPSPKKPKISLFDDLNDIASTSNKENAGPSQNSSDIDDELNKYLASGCANSREDPLTAWRQMAPKFPILSKIARKFLTAPATSVPSEATFKVARDVYDYRRPVTLTLTLTRIFSKSRSLLVTYPEKICSTETIALLCFYVAPTTSIVPFQLMNEQNSEGKVGGRKDGQFEQCCLTLYELLWNLCLSAGAEPPPSPQLDNA